MKKNVFAILLLFGFVNGIAQSLNDIAIINENKNSISLEFAPKIHSTQVLGTDENVFTKFSFFESQISYDSIGRADFFRAMLLMLPSSGYSLKIISSEYFIKDSVKLLPKPTIKILKDYGVSESYSESMIPKSSYESDGKNIVEMVRVGKTSIGFVGTLVFHPIQRIDQNHVKIFSKIRVRLDFNDAFTGEVLSSSLLKGNLPKQNQLLEKLNVRYKKANASDYPLAQGDWYRIEIQESRMYKIDYAYLHQLNISYNDIGNIRLFGNGGRAIPDNNSSAISDSLAEISRLVVRKNSSGIPDPDDYIVFYGKGTRGWQYSGGNEFQHYINPYSEKNYYFFTLDLVAGKSMVTNSGSTGSLPTSYPATFKEKIFIENETYNLKNSGRRWVGKVFSGTDNTVNYYNTLFGIAASTAINYRLNFLRRSASSDVLKVYENGQVIIWDAMSATVVGDDVYAYDEKHSGTWSGGLTGESSNVKIQIESSNQDAKTWLDWLEIYYQRKFEALNDVLLFTSPDLSGSVQYSVKNFSSNEVFAFDVTTHNNVKQITQLELDSTDSSVRKFKLQQTSGSVREIAVVGKSGLLVPSIASKIGNSTLHNPLNQAEFVIITPTEFISTANKLKSHRESTSDPLKTIVVDINQIYNEFACGVPDPLAIREFLKYTQNNWAVAPRYALLFGWGGYDYKNILASSQKNWLSTYETEESFIETDTYTSDDMFGIFGSGYSSPYAIAIGRLPVRTLSAAEIAVNKIISYETNSVVDPWRNRITFIADDGKTSEGDDGGIYTSDTEYGLAENTLYTPKSFEKKKIYIVTYPTVNTASGRRKPDVNRAIVDAINQGSLVTNFVGHGNERLWAHESIFTREDNLPQLSNKDRLTFVVAATCSYGRYDDPKEISSAELLVTMEQGGAIADISAARVVYEGPNITLTQLIFANLLFKDASGQSPRLGDAWFYAKGSYLNTNSYKFHLFGDPTIKLLMPKNDASVDSIKGVSLTNSATSITVKSLEKIRISGTVQQKDSALAAFNGRGTLQLFDSKKKITIKEGRGTFEFNVDGSPLYRGDVGITNGKYSVTVPIPKDVTFGTNARLSMYAWNNQNDGVGYTEKIVIDGIDTSAVKENDGPQVSIFLDDYSFQSCDVVNSNPTLIVRLEDVSGINTSTVGVGHQLLATINNPERTFDLSNYYHSDLNTYQSGEVRYPIRDLSDGKYSLKVKAWDIQNNASEAEIQFEVHTADDFAILHLMNFPNPFSSITTFTFQRNSYSPINVEIKIFSIAGRLVHKFSVSTSDRFVKIPWDGRDSEGAVFANGIYFYKVIVRDESNKRSNEVIGKLAVVR
jgi:hypothetical protein